MKMSWRSSRRYKKWRALCIRRDVRCQCCGSIKQRHAHHIKSAEHHPSLKYSADNAICLCDECHMILHNKIAGGYRNVCSKKHLNRLIFIRDFFYLKNVKQSETKIL